MNLFRFIRFSLGINFSSSLFTKSLSTIGCCIVAVAFLSSCINQWPDPQNITYDVSLTVHCDNEWNPEFDMNYTRDVEDLEILYIFQIYKAGETSNPIKEFSVYSFDFSRSDFKVELALEPGSYDIYAWSDICNSSTGKSIYYNSSDFSSITYTSPYEADSNNKDAFRGMLNIKIKESIELEPAMSATIVMQRPLSRYVFVSTDFQKFIDNEVSEGKIRSVASNDGHYDISSRDLQEQLAGYTIKVLYPLYMPARFDIFSDKPYDSWSGISFEGGIYPISTEEAVIALDYVMIGNDPSLAQVSLEIYNNEGAKIGGTGIINIPIERNRTTYVYGEFLTAQVDAGIIIDPDFDGQYNIEYH